MVFLAAASSIVFPGCLDLVNASCMYKCHTFNHYITEKINASCIYKCHTFNHYITEKNASCKYKCHRYNCYITRKKIRFHAKYRSQHRKGFDEHVNLPPANVYAPEIIVDEHVYLPPAPSHHGAHGLHCSGGVVLASRDGKLVCEDTLDARLDVVFRKKLPEVIKDRWRKNKKITRSSSVASI